MAGLPPYMALGGWHESHQPPLQGPLNLDDVKSFEAFDVIFYCVENEINNIFYCDDYNIYTIHIPPDQGQDIAHRLKLSSDLWFYSAIIFSDYRFTPLNKFHFEENIASILWCHIWQLGSNLKKNSKVTKYSIFLLC